MVLEMIDELAAWGHRPPALIADAGYGEITVFRSALTERHILYMVAVKASTSAFLGDAATDVLEYSERGPRPHQRRYLEAPSSLKDLVVVAAAAAAADRLVRILLSCQNPPDMAGDVHPPFPENPPPRHVNITSLQMLFASLHRHDSAK